MTDDRVAILNDLLSRVLELPAEQRMAWVEALGPEHASFKARLRALLERAQRHDRRSFSTLPKLQGATTQAGRDDELG
ncbi:MAG TPA: hypothetical protein VMT34_03740, partial [Aggregatilineales bacterium]|nr:hypothetical protein [Aggregatilineales bacterium]